MYGSLKQESGILTRTHVSFRLSRHSAALKYRYQRILPSNPLSRYRRPERFECRKVIHIQPCHGKEKVDQSVDFLSSQEENEKNTQKTQANTGLDQHYDPGILRTRIFTHLSRPLSICLVSLIY